MQRPILVGSSGTHSVDVRTRAGGRVFADGAVNVREALPARTGGERESHNRCTKHVVGTSVRAGKHTGVELKLNAVGARLRERACLPMDTRCGYMPGPGVGGM